MVWLLLEVMYFIKYGKFLFGRRIKEFEKFGRQKVNNLACRGGFL